jgi:adenylate cyclase
LRAYDYWLRGKKLLDRWSADSSLEARELLTKAVEIDPDFARGHAGLALAYEWCAFYSAWGLDPAFAHEQAMRHAQRAVELDDTDQLPHIVLAWLFHESGDHQQAQQHLALAAEINPNDADAMMNRAMILALEDQAETAVEIGRLAMQLNPRHPEWYVAYMGGSLFRAKRFAEAVAMMERAPESVPELRAICRRILCHDRPDGGRAAPHAGVPAALPAALVRRAERAYLRRDGVHVQEPGRPGALHRRSLRGGNAGIVSLRQRDGRHSL